MEFSDEHLGAEIEDLNLQVQKKPLRLPNA